MFFLCALRVSAVCLVLWFGCGFAALRLCGWCLGEQGIYVRFCFAYPASMKPNELTCEIIGAAIEVHRELGPGKPEAAYETALCRELSLRGIPHQAQKPVPVV